jgi:tetratricopeptide (TPR) repeat protein
MSYTHLNLVSGKEQYVWCELKKKEDGFLVEDLHSNQTYYVTTKTVGVDRAHGTEVSQASTVRFKVYFPPMGTQLKQINVYGFGKNDGRWQFRNIDLDKYRGSIHVDFEDYSRDYALAVLREGDLAKAQEVLMELLENKPDDLMALNMLGIISHAVDNNQNALYYFSQAIESNPNDGLAYVNRFAVYRHQQNYYAALEDINKAINVEPQPDNYAYRALLYMEMEDWEKAKNDWDRALETDEFKEDVNVYFLRIHANMRLNRLRDACRDIYTAYNLTNDGQKEKELQDKWILCGCSR